MCRLRASAYGRRSFLNHASTLGAAGLLGASGRAAAAEPPPEITGIRIHENPITCIAPQIIAEELLHSEGFTDVRYVTYAKWREIDVADSVRFWSLRLHDVGAIKGSPQQIIAQGLDLRFLNELKKELTA
jgi:hypothetical protein